MKAIWSATMLSISTLLTGCAGIDVASVNSEKDTTGLRFYETSPFLLMYTDNKGWLKSEILYLPDTTKIMSIKPYAYFAKNETALKFDNGRLSQSKSTIDETAIPSAVLSGLEKIATSQIKAANAGSTSVPSPYLFRIIRENSGAWALIAENNGQAIKSTKAKATIRQPVTGD